MIMTKEESRIAQVCSTFERTFRIVGVEGQFRVSPLGSYLDGDGTVILQLQQRGPQGWWSCGTVPEAGLRAALPGARCEVCDRPGCTVDHSAELEGLE